MQPVFYLFLVTLLAFVGARPTSRVTMESGLYAQPQWGWYQLGRADQQAELRLHFAMKLRNRDQFDALFWQITDPRSEKYGQYLTIDQLTDLIGPEVQHFEKVKNWLLANDITVESSTINRDFIVAVGSVSQWEYLLQTEFSVFRHLFAKKDLIKASKPYSLPTDIAQHVSLVIGVIGMHNPRPTARVRAASSVAADPNIGPAQLRERYNVTGVGTNPKNSMAVAEFQEQYYSPSDLVDFFQKYVSWSTDDKVAGVYGPNDASRPGIEAELDIQYIMGVGSNISTYFYSTPSLDFWSDLTSWVELLGNQSDCPLVHSVSYGDQRELQPSVEYKDTISAQFQCLCVLEYMRPDRGVQKLGARGISIIFASGDSGTGCDFCWEFQASFPATSPYVTSVGATHFLTGTVGPEGAVTAFSSGGGFSRVFGRPSYQSDAVQHYFQVAQDLPSSHYYNASGRGTPDVAALGIGFSVIVDGSFQSVGGTSASAPTFAAIVALLNDLRLNAGKPPLGFLNPWIYQTAASNPDAFFDVTQGSNPDGCCFKGFSCAPGWDPVTGVGTPNFAVLKTLI